MSDSNKSRLLIAYFHHFKIKANLSQSATEFLENDLILLRIFSEINEGKDIGYVPDIYKGDIFEAYLKMKIDAFPTRSKSKVLGSLYKFCARMLDDKNFSQIVIDGFEDTEREIFEQLIGEDIILRREVPFTGLESVGVENISFTYDELRDFLLAYYTVNNLAVSNPSDVNKIFGEIQNWPIYEGFFRYAYVLSRKKNSNVVLTACESSADFDKHYLNNLSLLSRDIQTTEDVERLKVILKSRSEQRGFRHVAWFLFRKRDLSALLNIQILLDHINELNDQESEQFIKAMFSHPDHYWGDSWQDNISKLLKKLNSMTTEQIRTRSTPALALALHFVPYAHWEEREATLNLFGQQLSIQEISCAINALPKCSFY